LWVGFALLAENISEYDEMVCAGKFKNGGESIVVSKQIDSGAVVVVEVVSNQRQALQTKTVIGMTHEGYEQYKKRTGVASTAGSPRLPITAQNADTNSPAITLAQPT